MFKLNFIYFLPLIAFNHSQVSSVPNSFVVHANYGIQSEKHPINNTHPITIYNQPEQPIVKHPQFYSLNLEESTSFQPIPISSRHYSGYQSQGNSNSIVNQHIIKSNDHDFQNMMHNLLKGTSKARQVIKIPALYEIHLEEQEQIPKYTNQVNNIFSDSNKFDLLPYQSKYPNIFYNSKPFYKKISIPAPSHNTYIKPSFSSNLSKVSLESIPRKYYYYANRQENGKYSKYINRRNNIRLMNGFKTKMRNSRPLLMPINTEQKYIVRVKEKPNENIVKRNTVIL